MATFPLDIRTELHLAGAWTDISSDVYVRDQKVISRGRRDQGAATDPSSLSLTLNNRDGQYSPRNAMSPMYGLLGRNTRVRVSVPGAPTPYLQMEGDGSKFVSTPHASALNVAGDLDVRAELAPNWYGADNQLVIGKWDAPNAQRSWSVRISQGLLYFHHYWAATGAPWFAARYLPVLPERAAVRLTFDADNGAGQREVRFYWAETLAGPWTEFGGAAPMAGTGGIAASTAPLVVGPTDLLTTPARLPFTGRGYAFQVRDGINGTVIASPDFTAQAAGTAAFTDSAGRIWTLADGTEIRDREDRFYGEISSWPAKWSLDGSDIWTPIQASGILRRLGQGQKPFDSALRRRIPSGDPVAYWPFEDNKESGRAYSPLAGVDSAGVTGVEFAALDSLISSSALAKLTANATLTARVPTSMPSGAWQVEFVYNADDKPPAEYTNVISISSANGRVRRWEIALKKGAGRVRGYLTDTLTLVDQEVALGADVFHGWVRLQFHVQDTSGGMMNWRLNFQDVGGDAGGTGASAIGPAGSVSYITGRWGAATEGWGFGHLVVLPEAQSPLLTGSDDAYTGETAWGRMLRLALEEKIPLARVPGELPPERVGYQRQEVILNLLESAAQADGGMLLEDRRRVGLVYRDRSSLYTQEPALTLSYTAPGLGPDLEPVDDDSAVRNDITVTRDGGTSGRAFLADGPLSVQPPPYGIGLYDEAVTLSLAHDIQPEPVANWRLHLGTQDGARYPSVSVVLHKPGADAHVPAILALKEGDKLRLTDLPPWVAHGDVDLIVEGWTETLDLYRWEIQFNCSPGGPWNLATVSHDTYGTVDTDGSELGAAVSPTATTLNVRTAGAQWTTDPTDMPIPLEVGGETMTVNAIGRAASDSFTRTVANGWGTADSGQPWTRFGSAAAADYAVNGSTGRHVMNSRNVFRISALPAVSLADVETVVTVTAPPLPTGDGVYVYTLARTNADVTSYYFARLYFGTTGFTSLTLHKRVPAETLLATYSGSLAYTAGQLWKVRLRVNGSTLSARHWLASGPEPTSWFITATDTALAAPGGVGLRSFVGSSNTSALPVTVAYDDFAITDSQSFTVVRSVNGVVKPHPAGSSVGLAHPAIASL